MIDSIKHNKKKILLMLLPLCDQQSRTQKVTSLIKQEVQTFRTLEPFREITQNMI